MTVSVQLATGVCSAPVFITVQDITSAWPE
jgi:hypothetical protein